MLKTTILTKAEQTLSNMNQLAYEQQLPVMRSPAAVLLFISLLLVSMCIFVPSAVSQVSQSEQTDTVTPVSTNDAQNAELANSGFDVLSAQAWMQRLANTVKEVPFEISFVVSSPQRETMPYIWRHATTDNADSAEQLSMLNGPGFEQVRINNKVSIFEPGFAPLSVRANFIDGPIPNAFIHNPALLSAGYDVLLMGRNRVSGRMAQQIRVISKDKSRYQYNLWLDEQTGLLLKLNMYDLKGILLKQIQVTQLSISDDVKEYFTNIQTTQLPPIAAVQNIPNQPLPWTLGFMPVGMEKVTENLRRISLTGQAAEYMMVSDGLIDVSIYVTKASDVIQEDIALTTDATSIVSISDSRIQVTVVGEIPLATAQKIAGSIVLK